MYKKAQKRLIISIIIAILILAVVGIIVVVINTKERGKEYIDSATGMSIKDGMPQPIYKVTDSMTDGYTNEGSDILRFVVYVETDYDTDLDNKRDLVKAVVQVPRKAATGEVKVPVIYEGSPYKAGTNYSDFNKDEKSQLTEDNLKNSPAPRVATGNSDTLTQAANADYRSWYYTFSDDSSESDEPEICIEGMKDYDDSLSRGYAVVQSAGLGTYDSEGIESCGSTLERDAFKSIVEWLHGDRVAYTNKSDNIRIDANWSNGKVAMTGFSYSAAIAYEVADTGVPGLETIIAVAGPYSWYDYVNSQGMIKERGNFDYISFLSSHCASRFFGDYDDDKLKHYEKYLGFLKKEADKARADYNEFWASRDYVTSPTNCHSSVLLIHGLNDDNVTSKQFDIARDRLKKAGCDVRTIIHQGGHSVPLSSTSRTNALYDGYTYDDIVNLWYAHYLLGLDNKATAFADIMCQSNITGEYALVSEWDSGEKRTHKLGEGAHIIDGNKGIGSNEELLENVLNGESSDLSACYSYSITESVTINGKIPVHLRIKSDYIGEGELPLEVYLVDYCEEPFPAYIVPEDKDQYASFIGENKSESMADYQVNANRKIISSGLIDLQNKDSGYAPASATKPAQRIDSGVYYDYVVYLKPNYYVVQPGHRLELYVTTTKFAEKINEGFNIEDYYKVPEKWTLNIDDSASFIELPVTKGSSDIKLK